MIRTLLLVLLCVLTVTPAVASPHLLTASIVNDVIYWDPLIAHVRSPVSDIAYSDYTIVIHDSHGQTIAVVPVELMSEDHIQFISVVFDFPDEARALFLYGPDGLMGNITIAENAPVLAPVQWDIHDDMLTIMLDADSNQRVFYHIYDNTQGVWRLIVDSHMDSTVTIPLHMYAPGDIEFLVVATDRFNMDSAVIGPITITDGAPIVSILNLNQSVFGVSEPVILQATSFQRSGHPISISWNSDIQGHLGDEYIVTTQLIPGNHTITATATSNGMSSSDSIVVQSIEQIHPDVSIREISITNNSISIIAFLDRSDGVVTAQFNHNGIMTQRTSFVRANTLHTFTFPVSYAYFNSINASVMVEHDRITSNNDIAFTILYGSYDPIVFYPFFERSGNNWCNRADINQDGAADDSDLAIIQSLLGTSGCDASNGWCEGADIDRSGRVELYDSMLFFNEYGKTSCEPYGVNDVINDEIAIINGNIDINQGASFSQNSSINISRGVSSLNYTIHMSITPNSNYSDNQKQIIYEENSGTATISIFIDTAGDLRFTHIDSSCTNPVLANLSGSLSEHSHTLSVARDVNLWGLWIDGVFQQASLSSLQCSSSTYHPSSGAQLGSQIYSFSGIISYLSLFDTPLFESQPMELHMDPPEPIAQESSSSSDPSVSVQRTSSDSSVPITYQIEETSSDVDQTTSETSFDVTTNSTTHTQANQPEQTLVVPDEQESSVVFSEPQPTCNTSGLFRGLVCRTGHIFERIINIFRR